MIEAKRTNKQRPDLDEVGLIGLLAFLVIGFMLAMLLGWNTRPGESVNQTAAVIGTVLLMVPGVFSFLKRSDSTQNPPCWFVAHVLCSVMGAVLIVLHVAGGNWLSPPGLVLFILIFLLVQGLLARLLLAKNLSYLFAESTGALAFAPPVSIDREALAAVIQQKVSLLQKLDPQSDEAVFSPVLQHWLRSPLLTLRYQYLIEQEYKLVGARQRAGYLLSHWRRLHMVLAAVLLLGLLVHIIVVLFFAGYVAAGSEIYWWYLADWGGK